MFMLQQCGAPARLRPSPAVLGVGQRVGRRAESQTGVPRNGGRAKQGEQDRFPEGADRVKALRRERRVAEPFGACPELAGGLSTCFHPAERLGLGCGEHGFHCFNQGQ